MPAAARLLDALRTRGWSLATAESVTGGLIAARITDVAGASRVFRGGLVAYHDDAKRDLLHVDDHVLARHGAASREVAIAMATGAQRRLGAKLAIATTGDAGPQASPRGEVGRVFLAIAAGARVEAHEMRYPGSRDAVRAAAVDDAFRFALEAIA